MKSWRPDWGSSLAVSLPTTWMTVKRTGLVVGYVQSGKTLSFTTVAALACDNRFPVVIVLSGTKKNLYSQTVKRLRRDLDLEHPAGRWVIFGGADSKPGSRSAA